MNLRLNRRHRLTAEMLRIADRQGISMTQLSERSDVSMASLKLWGRTTSPNLDTFERALATLGYRLTIRRRKP